MQIRQIVYASLAAPVLALAASSQTALLSDDFESGLSQWQVTGGWHQEAPLVCTHIPSPPSGIGVARFGATQGCHFGTSVGTLTTAAPVVIPPDASGVRLRFQSFEETECGYGNCGWDHRTVLVSTDGVQWTAVAVGEVEGRWIGKSIDLLAYAGQSLWVRFEFDPIDGIWNDFAGWLIDDVRVEIDPPGGPTIYCDAKRNSLGCEPMIAYSGTPSLSGPDDFHIRCTNVRSNIVGKFVWSQGPNSAPFHGGTLCVQVPAARTTPTSSLGTFGLNCSGEYSWHFTNAYLLSKGMAAGATAYVQMSARDPGFAAPLNHSLSAAVSFTLLP
jgi:hypothetical protein